MKKSVKIAMILGITVCLLLIFGLGILAWALPQPTYSEYERRDLEQMPSFNLEDFFAGKFTKQIEISFADTFAFRELFVEAGSLIDEAKGFHESGTIYGSTPPAPTEPEEPKEETKPSDPMEEQPSVDEPEEPIIPEEPVVPEEPEEEEPDDGATGETIAGIFVYKGIGFELLGRSEDAESRYASVVSKYRTMLPDSVTVYSMVVPKHAEFSLPKKYKSLTASAKDCIDNIYSQIDDRVVKVDAYSKLKEHSKEYIYFNTDHHWTGLGAYYGYTAFCEAAGLTPYKYEDYTKHTIEGFLGTLYTTTMDNTMKENPDYVEWCDLPVNNTSYQYANRAGLQSYTELPVMASYAKGVNSYGVYLHGDFQMTIIRTDIKNGRKCLIVKESYGNALSTYIASNFEETYVIDERYFEGNLVDVVKERGITDVLVVNNVSAANTKYHIGNIENLLTQEFSGSIVYPED